MERLLLLLAFLVSCTKIENIPDRLDVLSFEWTGGTMFHSPKRMTLKQIHLDKEGLVGKEIVIEGSVLEVGRFLTYAILSDNSARMLLVLTDVDNKESLGQFEKSPNQLRILGSVENGKKGLPYILVKALKAI